MREEILTAGTLADAGQEAAYRRLLARMPHEVDDVLSAHETVEGLRTALKQGRLVYGLVRKAAREYLEKVHDAG